MYWWRGGKYYWRILSRLNIKNFSKRVLTIISFKGEDEKTMPSLCVISGLGLSLISNPTIPSFAEY